MNEQRPWRTITIFVSSTFTDMEAERDYLNNIIANKLEHYFERKRISLKFIDLRWGVHTDKDEAKELREASVLKVCLDEIRRSRPFFIALLGGRYGWVPPHDRFLRILDNMDEEDRYLLRDGEGASVTALEILFGALGKQSLLKRSLFYFRDDASYNGMSPEEKAKYIDLTHSDRQSALKQKIRQECEANGLSDNIQTYHLQWEQGKFTGLDEWGNKLEAHLRHEIESEIAETQETTPQNWYEMEKLQHDIFVHKKTELFIGQKEILNTLLDFTTHETGVKILTGWACQGRSAIICQLYRTLTEQHDPNRVVLLHCAGISQHSRYTSRMFRRWSRLLCKALDKPFSDPEENSQQARTLFLDLVHEATQKGKKIVLLIDSSEEFYPSDDASNYSWLPDEACTVITTVMDNYLGAYGYIAEILENKPNAEVLPIPFMKREEARQLIVARCRNFHKTIGEELVEAILNRKADEVRNRPDEVPEEIYGYYFPYWNILLTDYLILMGHDDYEKARNSDEPDEEKKLENYLAQVISTISIDAGVMLINYFVPRLYAECGKNFTLTLLYLISLNYRGIREQDLAKLLGTQWDELAFAKFHYYLRSILTEDCETGAWNFAHPYIGKIFQMVLPEKNREEFYNGLARYYYSAKEDGGPDWAVKTMYYLFQADMKDLAAVTYASSICDEWNYLTPLTEEITERIKENPNTNLQWFIDMCCYPLEESDNLKGDNHFHSCLHTFIYKQLYEYTVNSLLPAIETIRKELALAFAIGIENKVTTYCRTEKTDDRNRLLNALYAELAYLYKENGDIENHRKYILLIQESSHKAPNNNDEPEEQALLEAELGTAEIEKKQYAKAVDHFRNAYRIFRQRYEKSPADSTACASMAYICIQLSDVYSQWKKENEYSDYLLEALSFLPFIKTDKEQNLRILGQLYDRGGLYYTRIGDTEQAERMIKKCSEIYRQLHQNNLNDNDDAVLLGIAYERMGTYYEELKEDFQSAYKYYLLQYETFRSVLDKDPSHVKCARFLAIAAEHLSAILCNTGREKEAVPYYQETISLIMDSDEKLWGSNEISRLAYANWALADILRRHPDMLEPDIKEDIIAMFFHDAAEWYLVGYQVTDEPEMFSNYIYTLYNLFTYYKDKNDKEMYPALEKAREAYRQRPSGCEIDEETRNILINEKTELKTDTPKQPETIEKLFAKGSYDEIVLKHVSHKNNAQESLLYGISLLRTNAFEKAEQEFLELIEYETEPETITTAIANLLLIYLLRQKTDQYRKVYSELTREQKTDSRITFLQNIYLKWKKETADTRPWHQRLFYKHTASPTVPLELPKPYGWIK